MLHPAVSSRAWPRAGAPGRQHTQWLASRYTRPPVVAPGRQWASLAGRAGPGQPADACARQRAPELASVRAASVRAGPPAAPSARQQPPALARTPPSRTSSSRRKPAGTPAGQQPRPLGSACPGHQRWRPLANGHTRPPDPAPGHHHPRLTPSSHTPAYQQRPPPTSYRRRPPARAPGSQRWRPAPSGRTHPSACAFAGRQPHEAAR